MPAPARSGGIHKGLLRKPLPCRPPGKLHSLRHSPLPTLPLLRPPPIPNQVARLLQDLVTPLDGLQTLPSETHAVGTRVVLPDVLLILVSPSATVHEPRVYKIPAPFPFSGGRDSGSASPAACNMTCVGLYQAPDITGHTMTCSCPRPGQLAPALDIRSRWLFGRHEP